jgi:exodeoxyribonuclease VII large subunit
MDTKTVTEINEEIKNVVSKNMKQKIFVKGEIANVKKSNGNAYFSLKDENSNINVVFWKIPIEISNGDNVIVDGKIAFYPKQGTYQISANSIEKQGLGDLHKKYNKLKELFESKKYFTKKRQIPDRINKIGILTSTEGAALQDILYVLRDNFVGEIYIKNCLVQGTGCASSVKSGIQYFNNMESPVDILVIARGGGAMEDLMGYSTEDVVKSIYESKIFTISAIGHEIDSMLSDFSADYRAPTPSIAGEVIVKCQKKQYDVISKINEKIEKIKYHITSKINSDMSKLENLKNIYKYLNPESKIDIEIENLEKISKKIQNHILGIINNNFHDIDKLKTKNNLYDVKKNMNRGYVIITDMDDNIIDSIDNCKQNLSEKFKILFADGTMVANIKK